MTPGFLAVVKRELKAYLNSPIVYVYVAMFTLICGYFFYRNFLYFTVVSLQSEYASGSNVILNITEAVIRPVHSNYVFVLLIVVPLITMRVFAEEKKTGTLELLIAFPLRYIDVVVAKLISAFVVVGVALLLTALFPLVVAYYGRVEVEPVITSYIGLLFVALSFVAVGTFFSSLTENQIIAAVTTFGMLLLFWALEWTAALLPGTLGRVMSEMSVYNHFRDFNRGILNSNNAIFYLNVTIFFVALTLTNLQRQSWKS